MQRRNQGILVRLEERIHLIVHNFSQEKGISMSEYARGAIIKDLQERGLLTSEMIASITT